MKINIQNMNKSLKIMILTAFVMILANTIYIVQVDAQVSFESLPDNKVFNDFVVGPGKIEMELTPGETGTFDLIISNRLGTQKTFGLSFEDFTGSSDPKQTVVLLGDDKGPYSLRNYVKIGTTSLDLAHANRVRVPVSVSVPKNAEPGGLYGSVIVGIISKSQDVQQSSGVVSTNPIITRIGTLIFVRIKGEVKQDAKLSDFKLAGNRSVVSGITGVNFNLFFKNDGNVHLNPKGTIKVSNMLGTNVGEITVEPWFAMPKSLRFREVSWKPNFLFGRYTALATIDRGYGNIKDEIKITFWAIPWQIIFAILVFVIFITVFIKKIKNRKTKIIAIVMFIILLSIFIASSVKAESMSSSNYKLESDSINFGGGRSLSGSYTIEDTAGEIATGDSSSSNFKIRAGYQQYSTVNLYVTPASDVIMSPSIPGLTGGTANGQTSLTVTTDNPAGYMTTISALASPALNNSYDSFADYTPSGAVPDYTFSNSSTNSSFAFTPEGADIATRYKNTGATCGIGSDDDTNACWDGLSVADKTIAVRNSSNIPNGTVTTLKFRAEAGSQRVQKDGIYTATTTITVLSL